MRHIIGLALICAAAASVGLATSANAARSRDDVPWVPPTATSTPLPVPTRSATPVAHHSAPSLVPWGWPIGLTISRFGVRASMEYIDLQDKRDREAPFNVSDVAWYDLGPRPGDVGHAVIFGHLDSTCCPAVFWHLKDLNAGDIVSVRYPQNRVLNFQVIWQHSYRNTQYPTKFIFGPSNDRGLVLSTCTGTFHRDGTGYDSKRVVYARLILPNGKLG